jgi:phage-related protein
VRELDAPAQSAGWRIEAYATPAGDEPVWSFIRGLAGRDRVEAIALVKLLEELGNQLRRPHSAALGGGLFELRGKQVRLFYVFEARRVIVLLDGEIKKRAAIPKGTLARIRAMQAELQQRGGRLRDGGRA